MIDRQDEIDEALLARVKETQCYSMSDLIKPFLLEKSESVLRTRVKYLALHGLIRMSKNTHGKIICSPANENSKADVYSTGGADKDSPYQGELLWFNTSR